MIWVENCSNEDQHKRSRCLNNKKYLALADLHRHKPIAIKNGTYGVTVVRTERHHSNVTVKNARSPSKQDRHHCWVRGGKPDLPFPPPDYHPQ